MSKSLPKELAATSSSDYVLINQEEMDMLSKYILDYRNIETGGQLFGYWTYDGKPVVLFVLGPGPRAGHHSAFFMQDLEYLKSCARLLKQKYGLDHIGEWHSHHQLGLSHPSGHDARNIATNIRHLGYSKFLLCIGTCTDTQSAINAFMFRDDNDNYTHVPWFIKDTESPYRRLIEKSDISKFVYPKTKHPQMGRLYEKVTTTSSTTKIKYDHSYWLTFRENKKILKQIIDNLCSYPTQNCIPTLDNKQEVHLITCRDNEALEDIHFPLFFPIDPPIIRNPNGAEISRADLWKYTGDILESFTSYYKKYKFNNYDDR